MNKSGKRNPNYKHGLAQKGNKHPLYNTWHDMKRRCNATNRRDSRWYSGKGIKVCALWEKDFYSFYEWSIESGWQRGLTIDRIDSSKGYSPNNCQWISFKDNIRKAIKYKTLTAFGETKKIIEWLSDNRCQVCRNTLTARLSAGVKPEVALTHKGMMWY